jgi:predicted enzyme related to lactoylglutathione lyase
MDSHDRTANIPRIDYVEFNVANIERAKGFYGAAFGWTFVDYSDSYCEFNDGRLRGGFTTQFPVTLGGALVVLSAADLEATVAAVEAAGGKITRPIFSFPGGRRFQFTDLDGYELGVWSEK